MSHESRSKMISFRLSAEEYEKFRVACLAQGVRSASEMARAAISVFLQQPGRSAEGVLEARVEELEGRLRRLSLEVKWLSAQKTVGIQRD